MPTEVLIRNRWERSLGLFVALRPGEGAGRFVFMAYGFLVMFSYYMLKTLREPLLLAKATAETKSYAYAVIALILLFVVPAYARHTSACPNGSSVPGWAALLAVQCFPAVQPGRPGKSVSPTMSGWGYSASLSPPSSGHWRPTVSTSRPASGSFPDHGRRVARGLVGPAIAGHLFQTLGTRGLMLIILLLIALTLPMAGIARSAVPLHSRSLLPVRGPATPRSWVVFPRCCTVVTCC